METARQIAFRGSIYKLKPKSVVEEMPVDDGGFAASIWIMQNTYARGYSKAPAQGFPSIQIK